MSNNLSKMIPGVLIALTIGAVIFTIGWFFYATWPRAMSNDEVIDATKKCLDADMYPDRLVNGLSMGTVRIQCIPKEKS